MPESITVLDFDAIKREKRNVKIDGVHYPLMDPESFGTEEKAEYRNLRKLQLELGENPTPANIKAEKAQRDKLVKIFVPGLVDNPVFDLLKEPFKEQIIEVFFEALETVDYRPKPGEQTTETDQPTQ